MDPAAMRAARRAERIARITASGSKGSGLLASTPSRARAALREVNTTPGPSAPKGDIGVASATAATSSSANPPSPPFVPPPPQFEEEEAQQAVTPAHAAARPMTDPMPTPSASVFSAIDAMLSDDDEDDDVGSSATAPPPPLPSLSATANKPAPPSVAPRRPAPPVPPTSTSVVAKATKDAPTRGGGSSNSSRVAVSSSTSSAENGKDRASAHVATSSPNPAASNTLLVRQAAPPPPPPLAMLRQSTVTELLPPLAKASDAVAVRRSSVKRTAPSDAADNEDSTPVMETPKPPPRRAKRSRSQRTTAALAAASATQWAAAGTDASGVGSASMDIDSKPAGSHSSTVTAGINTVVLAGGGGGSAGQRKRSPAEEISLQRQLCVKAAEMAALLARSGDHDMAIEAAKTSVIESLRLEVLETDVTTSVTAPSADSSDTDIERRDVQLSGVRVSTEAVADPASDCVGFFVFQQGSGLHATPLLRLRPGETVDAPASVLCPALSQDFSVNVTLYAASVQHEPAAGDTSMVDDDAQAPRSARKDIKSVMSKLKSEALHKIKSRLHHKESMSGGRGTPAQPLPVEPVVFHRAGTIIVTKANMERGRIALDLDTDAAGCSGFIEVNVTTFSRAVATGTSSHYVSGYLSFFERNEGESAPGRWRRFYTRMDGAAMKLWKSSRDANWSADPVNTYRLTQFTEGARRLSQAECARKHTLALKYDGRELRVACDSSDDADRWIADMAVAVGRAKAWEVAAEK